MKGTIIGSIFGSRDNDGALWLSKHCTISSGWKNNIQIILADTLRPYLVRLQIFFQKSSLTILCTRYDKNDLTELFQYQNKTRRLYIRCTHNYRNALESLANGVIHSWVCWYIINMCNFKDTYEALLKILLRNILYQITISLFSSARAFSPFHFPLYSEVNTNILHKSSLVKIPRY